MDKVTYRMANPYAFCGPEFYQVKDDESKFIDLLCKKANISPKGVSVVPGTLDSSCTQYADAQVQISGGYNDVTEKIHRLCSWFWDPKNELLKFHKVD